MTAVDQCSRCDAVDECVAGNITSLEDVAGVIGCPPPSLHVHLVQHDRDDLLRRLTYTGEPILPPKLEETTVVLSPAGPDLCDCGCLELSGSAVERGGVKHTAELCASCCRHGEFLTSDCPQCQPQPVPAVELDEDKEDDQQEGGWPEQPRVLPVLDIDRMWLLDLGEDHPSEDVRCAAEALISAIDEWQQSQVERCRLEQLVAQRDQLNAEIEELAARLGDVEPQPAEPVAEEPAPAESAKAIRAWCRDNGVHCPATGRVPRAAVEAYQEAHS